jgi:SAM-dependent methyltransferase
MHQEARDFIAGVKSEYPQFFVGRKVLEVGSLDINGSVREFFEKCDYTGIDLGEGPGVDTVALVHEYEYPDSYDVVISAEMLEHDKHWRKSLTAMYRNVKVGGLLVVSCAGPTRLKHGVVSRKPGDSPFTTDYYRNISVNDFEDVLPPTKFLRFVLALSANYKDLYFFGIKGGDGAT